MSSGDFIIKPAFGDNPHAKVELRLTARQYGKFFRYTEEHGPTGPVGLTMLSLNQLGARLTHHAAEAVLAGLARDPNVTAEDRAALEGLASFLFREAKLQGVTIARSLLPNDAAGAVAATPQTDQFAQFRVTHRPQKQGPLVGGSESRPCRREPCGPRK